MSTVQTDPHRTVDELVEAVAARAPGPVDSLHVAALLESMAINDDHADQLVRGDIFDLAKTVHQAIAQRPAPAREEEPAVEQRLPNALVQLLRGPLSLVPVVILLATLAAWNRFAGWGVGEALAYTSGITTSMFVTHPFVQAINRRGAIYVGRLKHRAARQFVTIATAVALATVVTLALVAVITSTLLGVGTMQDRVVFAASLILLGSVWLTTGILVLAQRTHWLGIGLVAGFGAASALFVLTGGLEAGTRMAVATGMGAIVTLATMLFVIRAALRGNNSSASRGPMVLSRGYAIAEAIPYFVYGLLYMVFILVPHVLGWFGRADAGTPRSAVMAQVELGLTLALLPLMLAGGVGERTAQTFWPFSARAQRETPASARHEFGAAMARFHRAELRRYLVALVVISALAGGAFELLLAGGQLQHALRVPSVAVGRWVFWPSLLGYALMGWGTFNCLFSVSLGRSEFATRAFRSAIVTTLVVGVPLCGVLGYGWSGAAFLAGATALVISSQRGIRDLTTSAGYFYSSSF